MVADGQATQAAAWLSATCFESHDAVLDMLWSRLERGARDRRSPWHTPVVATVGLDGAPEARVMVLRNAERNLRCLRLHSDARAVKVAELAARPASTVLLYDAPARLQLRARGVSRFLTEGQEVEAAWAASRPFSRRCYAAPVAPGSESALPTSGLPSELEHREPTWAESQIGRRNFGILLVELLSLEWLFLAHAGHRRGRLTWDGQRWTGQWLVP